MEKLNFLELQNIQKLIIRQDTIYQKLINYSSNCVDPQIKQMLIQEAQNTLNYRQEIISFLN